jgi:Protein of unknown function (DUF1549)/Protein of unknown function (DUF1553)/Planctomycete cytochrome C
MTKISIQYLLFVAFFPLVLSAGESSAPVTLPPATSKTVDFVHDIQPLLRTHCWSCHGPDKQRGDLRLDRKADALRGGQHVAILPGKSAESLMVRNVAGVDPDAIMPPPGKGERLTPEEIGLLRAWIDQGAIWPDGVDQSTAPDPSKHWAFSRPQRPAEPTVQTTNWIRNPIDRFVLARLEREGLTPSPEADRAALLRRVSLDITGIPPTTDELDAFLANKADDAYERVVDALLASPRYGERWARPWLDAARYGDTHGYEKDPARSIWPWRDWVIRALNADMPYDQFTIEQLAGDLLPNATEDQRIATGFHRNSLLNDEGGVEAEEFRAAAIIDRVNTTGMVWMGLTLACAQCHNHKYDPVSMRDYYAMYAVFNSTEDGGVDPAPVTEVPTPEQRSELARIRAEIATLNNTKDDPAAKSSMEALRKSEKALLAKVPKSLVMRELAKPRPTRILLRGSHHTPGDPVQPAVPASFPQLPAGTEVNRLSFAKWLVADENPLTARVTINRMWGEVFGLSLVETPEDFGMRGEPPSHPELLDWLATELVRLRWSQKAALRLIVTSATYRQSSRATPSLLERDPRNKLLARGPRFRVEAEMIRDITLTASGRLVERLGGPPVKPPQPAFISENSFGFQSFAGGQRWVDETGPDRYRRGLYTYWRRTTPYPTLQIFDAGTRDVCKVRRSRTNTPLQALSSLNEPLSVECGAALAQRLLARAESDAARLAWGYRTCTGRLPTADQVKKLSELLATALTSFHATPTNATNMLKVGLVEAGGDTVTLAAWMVVANVLLNLDETLTKG